MKFELVDFYPITDKNRGKAKKNLLGTVHIYVIECQLDLRGIRVSKNGKGIFFQIPHLHGQDHETGDFIKYPVFRFTNPKDHENMMNFLHSEVKENILKRIENGKS